MECLFRKIRHRRLGSFTTRGTGNRVAINFYAGGGGTAALRRDP